MNRQCERPDDLAYSVWPLLLEAQSSMLDAVQKEIGDLPLTWYDVLVQLVRSDDGRLSMRKLADSVLLSKSGITRVIDKMERVGLIERGDCATDRRVVYAVLTDAGRAAYEEASPKAVQAVRDHFLSHITDTEAKAMRNALTRVLEAHDPQYATERAV